MSKDLMHCDEHSGLMEAVKAIKSNTDKIPAMDKKIDVHLAEHRARSKTIKMTAVIAGICATLLGAAAAVAKILGV